MIPKNTRSKASGIVLKPGQRISRSENAVIRQALGVNSRGPAAPPSAASRQSWASTVSSRSSESVARNVSSYAQMLLDPMGRLTHLTSSSTFTASALGTVATFLRWKVTNFAVTGYPTIAPPANTFATLAGTDYGAPQAAWQSLNAIDRTLALGIRTRLVGLPTSTFLPSGTLQFLQVQEAELSNTLSALDLLGEPAAIQAVTAGKGFSMTVNELSKLDGVVLPFLPQGPMSFVFSDNNSAAAAAAGAGAIASTVVSSNPVILVAGQGLEDGLKLRFDQAHHIEYIPTTSAAGLIATKVEPPSGAAREGIARASQIVQSQLAGSTSAAEIRPIVAPGATIGNVVMSLGRAAVGMVPGGSAFMGAASSVASSLGAPAWLKSALASLA